MSQLIAKNGIVVFKKSEWDLEYIAVAPVLAKNYGNISKWHTFYRECDAGKRWMRVDNRASDNWQFLKTRVTWIENYLLNYLLEKLKNEHNGTS